MKTALRNKKNLEKIEHAQPELGLLQKVSSAIKRYDLLKKGATVVVGVSGGPDSMVLLHVLQTLKSAWQIKIVAAHLNHKTRRGESDRDQKFVERWAKRWGIPCVAEELNAPEDKSGASWENFWREARWKFFTKVAQTHGAKTIALAHHMNDQAETVLVRILRGTGPGGLAAMRPGSSRSGLRIIRPLLSVSREEITEYARDHAVRYVEDSSNLLPTFLRNRVRHDLLPHIETNYQEKIQTLLARLATVSAEEEDFIEQVTLKAWDRVLAEEFDRCIALHIKNILNEHPVIQYRIIRKAAEKLGAVRQIDFAHGEKIRELLKENTKRAIVLPKGIEVRRERNLLVISNTISNEIFEDSKAFSFFIHVNQECLIDKARMHISVRQLQARPKNVLGKRGGWREIMDGDSVQFPLEIRTRREGDRFHPLGQAKPMKLKNFLMREHFSSHRKSFWPMVISKGQIVWIPGYRLSNVVKVGPNTQNFIELTAEST